MAGSKREEYAIELRGDCLGQFAPPGTVIHFVPGEEIRSGDLVSIIFDLSKPGPWATFGKSISEDGFAGVAKIFLAVYEAGGSRMGLFGQLNPPGIVPIPMSAVLAIDRADFHGEFTGLDCEALAMLQPFAAAQVERKEAA